MEFKSVTIPVFPVMFPSVLPLIANELIAVQPMPLPTCHLFDPDERYRLMADEIAKEIDREILESLKLLPIERLDDRFRARYPHPCPRCAGPAYVGLNDVDCSKGCY